LLSKTCQCAASNTFAAIFEMALRRAGRCADHQPGLGCRAVGRTSLAAVALQDAVDDGHAQAGPLGLAAGGVEPVERARQQRQLFVWHAHAVVRHDQHRILVLDARGDLHFGHAGLFVLGVAPRVLHEVVENALDFHAVGRKWPSPGRSIARGCARRHARHRRRLTPARASIDRPVPRLPALAGHSSGTGR
jgi:hypothetical protein